MTRRFVLATFVAALLGAPRAHADWRADLARIAGTEGVIVVADATGQRHVDIHGDRSFVPASTLKVATALAALDRLGPDHHFETVFHAAPDGRLVVEGRGDPVLVSEELDFLARRLALRAPADGFKGIVLDDSRFEQPISIPGISKSTNPYDAMNGALAVNFNTIFVKRVGGEIVSAEPQTPLTPLAAKLGRTRGITKAERINLGNDRGAVLQYAGEVLRAFLERHGVAVGDTIAAAPTPPGSTHLMTHRSRKSLADVLAGSLEFSNNYTINQVLLALGLEQAGPPATLEKGLAAAHTALAGRGVSDGLTITEGSGISRGNRATADALLGVLDAFEPWRSLLPVRDGISYKTGSLRGIRTLVAYADHPEHGALRFVISLGGSQGEARFDVVRRVVENL